MSDYEEYIQEEMETTYSVFSVSHLMEKLSTYNEIITNNDIKGTLLFRGQSNTAYSLEASIFRNNLIVKETALINDLILQEPFEFGNQMTDFEQLVKMQHYGLPTRLLDLTTNPLVALYFACSEHQDKDGEIIVFIETLQRPTQREVKFFSALAEYDDKSLEQFVDYFVRKGLLVNDLPYKDKVDILRRMFQAQYIPVVAPKNNERIKRQNGSFLILGLDIDSEESPYYLKNTYNLKDILPEPVVTGETMQDIIPRYLTIPADRKRSIIQDLDRVGINESFVYPELEHQTSYIRNRHTVKAGE